MPQISQIKNFFFKLLVVVFFVFAIPALPTGWCGNLLAQNLLSGAKHDTTRCNLLNAMIEAENEDSVWIIYNEKLYALALSNLKNKDTALHPFFKSHLASALNNYGFYAKKHGELQKALEYYFQSLRLSEETKDSIGVASTLSNIGVAYRVQGDIKNALKYYELSLNIQERIGDQLGKANSLNNIGILQKDQGNIPQALNYLSACMRLHEQMGDKQGMAAPINNIGLIYLDQGEESKAVEFFGKGLKIFQEIGDNKGTVSALINLGLVSRRMGDNPTALKYYQKSLDICEKNRDKQGIAVILNGIGTIFFTMGDHEKALEYQSKSLAIQQEIGDKEGETSSLNNIGSIYLKQKQYALALKFEKKALLLGKELGFPASIRNAAGTLTKCYKALGDHKAALEHYELFIRMRDSINNETARKASIKQQLKHEYETKAAADSVAHAKESDIKNAELAKQKAELSAKKNQQYALFGGLFGVCVFGVFMFNRFKVTQKQKEIIEQQKEVVEEQKKLVEEKQKEILDSIQYARRIQMAQIPSEKRVENTLKRLRK